MNINTDTSNEGGACVGTYDDSATAQIYNNIIYDNTANAGGDALYVESDGDGNGTGSTIALFNNNLGPDKHNRDNNITSAPMLVDPENGDFHLQSDSLCTDAGNNSAPGIPDTDFEEDPRIVGVALDIAADEYSEPPVPIPDIKANGSDEPITLNQSDTLTITVSLNNNDLTENADWWLAADTPFGLYFYTFDGWTTDWVPAYQGPLFYLDSYEVLNIPVLGLPAGTYTFYFGVDTNMDGNVTWESVYYDTVVVNVIEYISDFSGTWEGSWHSTWFPEYSGSVSITISQVSNNLSADVTVTNTDFGTITANLSGTVNGNTFELSGEWSGGGYSGRLDINGTLSGNTITGNYDLYVDNLVYYDHGTFILER
ncbi:hypothetical protein [Candidatus Desulfofervidus auxilii]|nr:hypothetical protein [Candidatus Desulfofervidus auxilii]